MSNFKNLTSAIFIIGQSLLLNVLSIPATAYIVHRLGPFAYGQWAIATSLVAAAGVFASFGLRTLFSRDVAQNPAKAAEGLAHQLGLRTLLTLGASLLAMAFCLAMGYPRIVTICVALSASALMCTSLANAFADVFQGFQLIKTLAVINLAAGLVLTVLSITVMWLGAGPIGLALSYISGPLVCLLISAFYTRWKLFKFGVSLDLAAYRRLLKDSRLLGAQQLTVMIRDRIEQLVVPKLVGISGFGYFSAGLIPAARLVSVPDGFGTAFFPVISKAHARDKEEASFHSLHLMIMTSVVCMPVALLVAFFAGAIDQLLFPGKVNACRDVMQITIWSLPLVGVIQAMAYALQAAGKHEETAKSNMRATFLGAAISIALIVKLGIIGAAWSWVLRSLLACVFMMPLFMNQYPKVFPRLPISRIALSCGVMALGLKLPLLSAAPPKSAMFIGAFEAILAYVASLHLLGVMGLLRQNYEGAAKHTASTSEDAAAALTAPEVRALYVGRGLTQQPVDRSSMQHPLPKLLRKCGVSVWDLDVSMVPLAPPDDYDLASLRESFPSEDPIQERLPRASNRLLSYGEEIVRSHNISVILTAGTDAESHALAAALAARFGVPWLVDLREGLPSSTKDRQSGMGYDRQMLKQMDESAGVVLFRNKKARDHFIASCPKGVEGFKPLGAWAGAPDRAQAHELALSGILDAILGGGNADCSIAWSNSAHSQTMNMSLESL